MEVQVQAHNLTEKKLHHREETQTQNAKQPPLPTLFLSQSCSSPSRGMEAILFQRCATWDEAVVFWLVGWRMNPGAAVRYHVGTSPTTKNSRQQLN
jgi:hypothetical protein